LFWIVYGTPALVHPGTGVLLAFTLGMQYVLSTFHPGWLPRRFPREPGSQRPEQGGQVTAARKEFGDEWVFGGFLPQESKWLNKTYQDLSGME